MSVRKFDFEVIYFTNEVVAQLEDEGVLMQHLILPDKLRYIILQLIQNNYDIDQSLSLSKEQLIKALDHANELSVNATMDEMLKDGLIEYDGITNDGECIIKLTEEGEKATEETPETLKMVELIQELQQTVNKKKIRPTED